MMLTLEIPDPLGEELRRQTGQDISRQFIEAWAAEAYRMGRASTGKLARLLGMEAGAAHPDAGGGRRVPRHQH